jgi:predicted Zn-dependent protease
VQREVKPRRSRRRRRRIPAQDAVQAGTASLAELIAGVERGQLTQPLTGTLIAGNVYTALQEIEALSAEGEWSGASWLPHVLVRNVEVSSKE